MFSLQRDRFNPPDVFGGMVEPFGLEIFFHMLWVRGAGQREHPDLHGEPEDDLRDPGRHPRGDGPNFRIGTDWSVGGQQRKALIDASVGPANVPYLVSPSSRGAST